jgi:threonine/homoserine/homoserine lactone efflux protein
MAFQVLKHLGVAYLLYMAWATIREKGALAVEADAERRTPSQVILSGVLVNVLNPKLTIFFVAFLPQFVDQGERNPHVRLVVLSAVFMAVTFVVFAAYGAFAAAVRDHVVSRPQIMTWLRRSFAASFVGLGAKLATTTR